MNHIKSLHLFVKDIYNDGHRFFSLPYPFISFCFTITKALGINYMGIQGLSYTWAIFPLLIWVVVAYAHRRAVHNTLLNNTLSILNLDCGELGSFIYEMGSESCYRFSVVNSSSHFLQSCVAQIIQVTTNDGENLINLPILLARTSARDNVFSLRPSEKKYIDLLAIGKSEYSRYMRVAPIGEEWPVLIKDERCLPRKCCIITIQVLSELASSIMDIQIEFSKNGCSIKKIDGAKNQSPQ